MLSLAVNNEPLSPYDESDQQEEYPDEVLESEWNPVIPKIWALQHPDEDKPRLTGSSKSHNVQ
jgi:hypothetical protein